jgi:hypothetical protein
VNAVNIHEIVQTVGAHEIEGCGRASRVQSRFAEASARCLLDVMNSCGVQLSENGILLFDAQ